MAFCTQCGAQLPDGSAFCTNCGARLNPAPQNPPVYQQPQQGYQQPVQQGYQRPAQGYQQPMQNYQQPQQPAQPGYQQPVQGYQQPAQPGYQQPQQGYQPPVQPGYYPQGGRQAPKKKKTGLIIGIIAAVLVLAAVIGVVVFLLTSGGSGSSDPAVLGRYNCQSCYSSGKSLDTTGQWIELQKRGKAEVYILNELFKASWDLEGERFTLTQNGTVFAGTLKNGVITIDMGALEYTFLKQGAVVPVTTAAATEPTEVQQTQPPTTEPAPAVDFAWWEGDWYGWWVILDGTGKYSGREGDFWDCCASISTQSNGTGVFTMWDTRGEGEAFVNVDVWIEANDGKGIMYSVGGTFDDGPVTPGTWMVDPSDNYYTGSFANMLCIEGVYVDPANSEDTLTYLIFLRHWGDRWDDVQGVKDPGAVYDDMMPAYYEDWYLPLIESGVKHAPNPMLDD